MQMITLTEQLINLADFIIMVDEGRKMTDGEKDARWGPVVGTFDSSSDPGKRYEVRRKAKDMYSCQCKGWVYHRHCKHCDMAAAKRGEHQGPYNNSGGATPDDQKQAA